MLKIQNQAVIAGMQGRRRLAKMRLTIDIGYPVGQPTSIL
jgi:hypothetical protein